MSAPAPIVCTDSSLDADEALPGNSPEALGWVALEQDGPWGGQAWTQSHLDPDLGGAIERTAADHQVHPVLIRRPGRHPDRPPGDPRTVLVASSVPGRTWLLRGTITDPATLLDLPWAAVAAGDLDTVTTAAPWLAEATSPQLLVCTNGARDVCCARLGRPMMNAVAAQYPAQVWEVTHISGHRFAPTTVLLPSGHLHGRVLDGSVILASAQRGELAPGSRGRSCWPPAGQVAEEAVRDAHQITGLDDIVLVTPAAGSDEAGRWSVHHRDGREWSVVVDTSTEGRRSVACGRDPEPLLRYRVSIA